MGWATPTGTGFNSLKDDYEPGDLGFDPLGLKPTEPEALKEMQTKELNNGRLVSRACGPRLPTAVGWASVWLLAVRTTKRASMLSFGTCENQ